METQTLSYLNEYRRSLDDPAAFWAEQAGEIPWFRKPGRILSTDSAGLTRWFAGGKLNTCYAAVDYHVENGRADQTALIYDSPVTNTVRRFTYTELRDEVAQLAGTLKRLGVQRGDTVVIYMPMVPEAVFAMLACARIGAIHSVVFGGFAPHELALRIDDAHPKVILSASCGIEFDRVIPYKPLLDEALRLASFSPKHCLILQRPMQEAELTPSRDLDWATAVRQSLMANIVPVNATDPLYILYTSGTTGKPKGIIRDNGGHAVALKYSMRAVYDVQPGDTFWAASDLGWAVGHSYIVYGPLLHGCTTILFEGKPVRTPDAGTFWRVIQQHGVKAFFTAPTAFRAIKKEDPEGLLRQQYDLSSLKYVFVAGERCDPPTLHWLEQTVGVPVIDHWWQTESGWPMVANQMGIESVPVKAGSSTRPVAGFDLQILDEHGQPLGPNEEGYVCLKLPLPPGCLPTLWNDTPRFRQSYLSRFPGYYLTGDGGFVDADGYVFIMGRVDDVINVAGHRLSTGEMEEIVGNHPAVAECAVVGIADELRGQRPIGLVVLKDGISTEEGTLENELVTMIRDTIGAVAYFRQATIVKRLPKTRSGKILRKTIRQIADGEPFTMPSTIDDPAILDEIRNRLSERSIGNAFAFAGL
ncbi:MULTISPECIES: propionyl-CoA synthetase [unclassified Spirosoma]|uniref:propionyl-CoA synthetase n=1 Tax=unclassified Spirosoma TaxID=2621999 RepID=UPI0009662C99|nr:MULTISPECIES: propionyl-CoA synthetase [unclassified Spirosoma]MBN8825790.1 propionyl-CoA synthetase [Spirosoma sp.]OJW74442.1 MAG: propionyl-CoA synthetase [Spirosoma sp. 48-14]